MPALTQPEAWVTLSQTFIALLDSLLGDRFSIHTSVRVMEHAAGLDLERLRASRTRGCNLWLRSRRRRSLMVFQPT